jgi:cobalt-zinc-cadmium efflux system protein
VANINTYQIIGLRSEEQAERIKGRICDVLSDSEAVELDYEHGQIKFPSSFDSYKLSLISAFEQVSIVNIEELEDNKDLKIEADETDHDHHHHSHAFDQSGQAQRNMLIVFFLNLLFAIAEFVFGNIFRSQAILSDAVHDLGDAISIGIAYLFEKMSNRDASSEYSYGYRRFSLLGAFVTSVILIIGATLVIINTVPVLLNPVEVNHQGVFWVAIGAIVINGISVWLMSRGQSANEKLLNIHLFEDLFGWIAVLLMSIILNFTDWYILDPILSLGIAGWILYVTIPEFFRIGKIFLQAVPEGIDTDELHDNIQNIDNVQAISHFHIWSTDGRQHMMSITVTTSSESKVEHEKIKQHIRNIVLEDNISHITIELLYDPDHVIKESISCEG